MLHVKLLGAPRILLKEQPLSSQITGKGLALLVYLLVTGRAHTRDKLAALLWQDVPNSQALKNLRDILPVLRQKLGPHLNISRQTIAFNRESHYWLDVEIFRTSLASDEVKTNTQLLKNAVELYTGDFLEGFHVRNAPAFEEWMENQRTQLNNFAIHGMDMLCTQYIEQKLYTHGLTISKQLLSIAPWHEEAHRYYMMLLANSGQRSMALAHFANCQQILLDELDVQPSSETVEIYEKIKLWELDEHEPEIDQIDDIGVLQLLNTHNATTITISGHRLQHELTKLLPTVSIAHNLEMPLTTMIGRKSELTYLQQCLDDPICRLVTILGSKGIGKSRLALELAHQIVHQQSARQIDRQQPVSRFNDGVYFVLLAQSQNSALGNLPHESSSTLSPLLAAIANALDDGLEEEAKKRIDEKQKLFRHLKTKQMLLVLDNFQYSPEHANAVIELLRQSPYLKVIVTSRQRLNVQGEWLLRLDGLSQLDENDENWNNSTAIHLFLQRAQQMVPGFNINAQNIVAIRRICQLVEGVPLEIELAAHWLYVLDCETIADEIAQNPHFLTSNTQDIGERQRSLMTSLDYAWHLLTTSEKYALLQWIHAQISKEKQDEVKVIMDLAQQRNKQALTTVSSDAEQSQISLFMLSNLINKSLLTNKGMSKVGQLAHQYNELVGNLSAM